MTRPSVPLSTRIRTIRKETHGEDGIPQLAAALGIPARTWENFEAGVKSPHAPSSNSSRSPVFTHTGS